MKVRDIFAFGVAILLITGISSCGKKNESDPGNNTANGTSNTNGLLPNYSNYNCKTSTSFQDFKNKVSQGQFVSEISNTETYYFVEVEPQINEGNWWIFDYNTIQWDKIRDFTRSSTKGSTSVSHEAGNTKTAVRNFLMNILNSASQNQVIGGGSYYEVVTYTGERYGINLCYPLAANPVSKVNQYTDRSYFIRGTGSSSISNPFGIFY